jgi:N-acetylmuramoyl-L-alanine amidase CwlA
MVNIKDYFADSKNYGKKRKTDNIKYIVIHYTGNDGDSDENNGKYFRNNIVKASAHYFVDDDSITRSVPDDYVAYSVGGNRYDDYKTTGGASLYKKCTNTNSISIELCDDVKDRKVYPSEKTIENALDLTKELMKKYNIPEENVIRHFDVTGKKCPAYWCGTDEKNDLWKTAFHNSINSKTSNTTKTSTTTKTVVTGSLYTQTQFIKDIQKAICARVDGIAGVETISKTVTVSAKKNRMHACVRPIQKRLNSLGYDCGTVDGIAGAKFKKAVVRYQKAKGCIADGEITARKQTWKKLLGVE